MKTEELRNELKKLYEEFIKISFPPVPMEGLSADFADWDGTIAGIANSYIKVAEDRIDTPLSIKEMIANYERDMREKYLIYKPSSIRDKKRFDEFLAYKSKLDKIVELVKLIEKNKDGKSQRI